jgi:hypothetical protein
VTQKNIFSNLLRRLIVPNESKSRPKEKARASYTIYHFARLHEYFRVVHFTDQEWKEIVKTFPWSKKFPRNTNARRQQIEAYLNFYLKYSGSLRTSLKTKRSIEKVVRYIPKLRSELKYLIQDPVFLLSGLPNGWTSPPDFSVLFRALDDLEETMDSSAARIQKRPGRKSTAPLDFLIISLNEIQRDVTSDNVIRSNKRTDKASGSTFIHLCCRKVGVSKSQVERAIKRRVTNSNKIARLILNSK